ncbi:MAG: hypothetical protein ABIZ80_07725 [Bryobacteraceae bacterium]
MAAAAMAFAFLQNTLAATGGAIAWSKLIWLACAILCWYLLPAWILQDRRLGSPMRKVHAIFYASMLLRGIIELWMIYGPKIWHPHYGATHDVLTAAIVAGLTIRAKDGNSVDPILRVHAFALSLMLVAETGFGLYFAANFLTQGEGALYFVPADGRHDAILRATAAADVMVLIYLSWFVRRWLYGQALWANYGLRR